MIEIERKFLVKNDAYKTEAKQVFSITQGYLNSHPERTTRIRIQGEKAYITIKGISSADGLARFEWEKPIAKADAEKLLKLCEPGIIDKNRYCIPFGKHTIEVDEFYGENKGLCLAEIELTSIHEKVNLPEWIGKEVTGQKKYYNAQLVKKPYTKW